MIAFSADSLGLIELEKSFVVFLCVTVESRL